MHLLAFPMPDPGFELLIASHGTSQGVRQTDGIQVFPRAFVRIGEVQIGGQWRNVSSPSAHGVAALFMKYRHIFRGGQIDAGMFYRIRTNAKEYRNSRAWEFSVSGRHSLGPLGLQVKADYSPKDFDQGKSVYVEIGPSFEIDKVTNLSGGVGRRERDRGPEYTSFNVGISRTHQQKLILDARYYQTNQGNLGPQYRGRLVFSIRLTL